MTIAEGKVNAGEILVLTSGEYSDYQVHTLHVARMDFDVSEFVEGYLQRHPKQSERYNFDTSMFIAELESNGLIAPLMWREFYLGSYNIAEEIKVIGDK